MFKVVVSARNYSKLTKEPVEFDLKLFKRMYPDTTTVKEHYFQSKRDAYEYARKFLDLQEIIHNDDEYPELADPDVTYVVRYRNLIRNSPSYHYAICVDESEVERSKPEAKPDNYYIKYIYMDIMVLDENQYISYDKHMNPSIIADEDEDHMSNGPYDEGFCYIDSKIECIELELNKHKAIQERGFETYEL